MGVEAVETGKDRERERGGREEGGAEGGDTGGEPKRDADRLFWSFWDLRARLGLGCSVSDNT